MYYYQTEPAKRELKNRRFFKIAASPSFLSCLYLASHLQTKQVVVYNDG